MQDWIILAQRVYYYPRTPLCRASVPKIMIFTGIGVGVLGLLLPWSLTNSGLWPHTPNVYTNKVATEPSGTEKYSVALQWQSGKQLAKWLSIGKIYPNFGLSGSGLV